MPIYEYKCDACEHRFEITQRMSDPRLTDCPDCGRSELRKLVSATAFRLKGGGWYETDFKSGSKRNVAEGSRSEGGSGSDGGGSDSGSGSASSSGSGDSGAKASATKESGGSGGSGSSGSTAAAG